MVDGYVSLPKSAETVESRRAIEKVRGVLDTVNEKVLFDIFREYFGKVGNEILSFEGTITPVSKVQILYDNNNEGLHGWYGEDGAPVLNAFQLSKKDTYNTLNTLVHEYLHELSTLPFNSVTYKYDTGKVETETNSQSGVSNLMRTYKHKSQGDTLSDSYIRSQQVISRKINEGITQILTDDICTEYLKRTGTKKDAINSTSIFSEAYTVEQVNVRIYIAFLSTLTGIDEDVIKNAVLRAYFRNGSIVPDEIKELLPNDIRPAEFLSGSISRALEKDEFIDDASHHISHSSILSGEQQTIFYKKCEQLLEEEKNFYKSLSTK
jgi:hypothetical protein